MILTMKNRNKIISLFGYVLCILFIFSFHSCNYLFNDDLKENESNQTVKFDNTKLTLVVSPVFPKPHEETSRSAYPDFNNINPEDYYYSVECPNAFSETEDGVYEAGTGTITFTINSLTFVNETVTFYAKDKTENRNKLWLANVKLSYSIGQPKTITAYFEPYNASTIQGTVNLKITTTSGYSIKCNIVDSDEQPVNDIEVSGENNECTLTTATSGGIKAGSYIAHITVYKVTDTNQKNPLEYVKQTINVWPGAETNLWYYDNGTSLADQNLNIAVNNQYIKIYVKGSSPNTGIYTSTSGLDFWDVTPSDTAEGYDGSMKKPFATVTRAVQKIKALNAPANYKIIISGTVKDNVQLSTGSEESNELGEFTGSTLTICGIDMENDKISGKNGGTILSIGTSTSVSIENLSISSNDVGNNEVIVLSSDSSTQKSVLTMNNCKIINNKSNLGTLLLTKNALLNLKGKILIDDNSLKSDTSIKKNLVVKDNNCAVEIIGALDPDSHIGITSETVPKEFCSGFATYCSGLNATTIFKADDNSNYKIELTAQGEPYLNYSAPYAKINDTIYYTKQALLTALSSASGNITLTLYSRVKASELGNAETEETIANAIKTTTASSIALIIPEEENIQISSAANMFKNCVKLVSADLRGLNTTGVLTMEYMFRDCSALASLNLSGFNLSSITRMSYMFYNCSALESFDFSMFATYPSNSFTMQNMFSGCSALETVNFTGSNISNVSDMSYMFYTCTSLKNIDLSNMTLPKLTNMQYMFYNCTALKTANFNNLKSAKLTTLWRLFQGCENLETVDFTDFDTSAVQSMEQMFISCKSLKSFDLKLLNTTSLTNAEAMFCNCETLKTLDFSSFNFSKITSMGSLVSGCTALESVNFSGINTSKVTNMRQLFSGCTNLTVLDLSDFDTSAVTVTNLMFKDCSHLTSIIVSSAFTLPAIGTSNSMFENCTSLVGGYGTTYNSEHIDSTYAKIDDGYTNLGYFTGKVELINKTISTGTDGHYDGSYSISGSHEFLSGRNVQIRNLIVSDHETTQGEYEMYCNYGGYEPSASKGKGYYYPVYYTNWYDAIIYCNLRSKAENLNCVYYVEDSTNPGTLTDDPAKWAGMSDVADSGYHAPSSCTWVVTTDGSQNGWRLPYDIEWEYLARGGNLTASNQCTYSGCPADGNIDDYVWYTGNSGNKAHPVKTKLPNAKGIYDMSGSVWEWTNDWYVTPISTNTPYTGPKTGEEKSTRGGGYPNPDNNCKISNRYHSYPNDRNSDMGFRIVRNADEFIGTKAPYQIKEPGDIVFTDGSSTYYYEFANLPAETKSSKSASAFSVIFYAGKGLNNGSDTTTVRTLGVGLKVVTGLAWCDTNAQAYTQEIDTIECQKSGDANNLTFVHDNYNHRNGSTNLEDIGTYLSNHAADDGTTNDTIGDGAKSRYPAFYFAKNYKETATNIEGTEFEDGWYLPSVAESYELFILKNDSDNGFNIDTVSNSLGGNRFISTYYWTSTQDDGTGAHNRKSSANVIYISSASVNVSFFGKEKTNSSVFAIREF